MRLTTFALLGGLWFLVATLGLTLGIMADINQAAAPVFPLMPVLVTQFAINAAGIVLVKAIGVGQIDGYRWYMPFEGGQSFVVVTAVALTIAVTCMLGMATYFFATFYIEPFYGLMSVQSFAIFIAQGLMLVGLTLFKKDSPNQWHWLSRVASSPNRETAIVAMLIMAIVIITNVAEMRVTVRNAGAVIAFILHTGCGIVVHAVIGWKMTPNYRLFMPIPSGNITSALAQAIIWLAWAAALQFFIALAIIPPSEAPPYAFVSTGLLSGLSIVSLIIFVRTFSEKTPRSASLLARHGLQVLSCISFALVCEIILANIIVDNPSLLPAGLFEALMASPTAADPNDLHQHRHASAAAYAASAAGSGMLNPIPGAAPSAASPIITAQFSAGAKAAFEASQQICSVFLIGLSPATHLLGSLINGPSYHTFQPFQGSVTFVVMQGLGWALYSFSLLFLLLSFVIDRNDDVHRMWLSAFGYTVMAAQMLLAASVRAFGTERVERAERRRVRNDERVARHAKAREERAAAKHNNKEERSSAAATAENDSTELNNDSSSTDFSDSSSSFSSGSSCSSASSSATDASLSTDSEEDEEHSAAAPAAAQLDAAEDRLLKRRARRAARRAHHHRHHHHHHHHKSSSSSTAAASASANGSDSASGALKQFFNGEMIVAVIFVAFGLLMRFICDVLMMNGSVLSGLFLAAGGASPAAVAAATAAGSRTFWGPTPSSDQTPVPVFLPSHIAAIVPALLFVSTGLLAVATPAAHLSHRKKLSASGLYWGSSMRSMRECAAEIKGRVEGSYSGRGFGGRGATGNMAHAVQGPGEASALQAVGWTVYAVVLIVMLTSCFEPLGLGSVGAVSTATDSASFFPYTLEALAAIVPFVFVSLSMFVLLKAVEGQQAARREAILDLKLILKAAVADPMLRNEVGNRIDRLLLITLGAIDEDVDAAVLSGREEMRRARRHRKKGSNDTEEEGAHTHRRRARLAADGFPVHVPLRFGGEVLFESRFDSVAGGVTSNATAAAGVPTASPATGFYKNADVHSFNAANRASHTPTPAAADAAHADEIAIPHSPALPIATDKGLTSPYASPFAAAAHPHVPPSHGYVRAKSRAAAKGGERKRALFKGQIPMNANGGEIETSPTSTLLGSASSANASSGTYTTTKGNKKGKASQQQQHAHDHNMDSTASGAMDSSQTNANGLLYGSPVNSHHHHYHVHSPSAAELSFLHGTAARDRAAKTVGTAAGLAPIGSPMDAGVSSGTNSNTALVTSDSSQGGGAGGGVGGDSVTNSYSYASLTGIGGTQRSSLNYSTTMGGNSSVSSQTLAKGQKAAAQHNTSAALIVAQMAGFTLLAFIMALVQKGKAGSLAAAGGVHHVGGMAGMTAEMIAQQSFFTRFTSQPKNEILATLFALGGTVLMSVSVIMTQSVYGPFIHGQAFKLIMPFRGGYTFVLLQGIGWGLFAAAWAIFNLYVMELAHGVAPIAFGCVLSISAQIFVFASIPHFRSRSRPPSFIEENAEAVITALTFIIAFALMRTVETLAGNHASPISILICTVSLCIALPLAAIALRKSSHTYGKRCAVALDDEDLLDNDDDDGREEDADAFENDSVMRILRGITDPYSKTAAKAGSRSASSVSNSSNRAATNNSSSSSSNGNGRISKANLDQLGSASILSHSSDVTNDGGSNVVGPFVAHPHPLTGGVFDPREKLLEDPLQDSTALAGGVDPRNAFSSPFSPTHDTISAGGSSGCHPTSTHLFSPSVMSEGSINPQKKTAEEGEGKKAIFRTTTSDTISQGHMSERQGSCLVTVSHSEDIKGHHDPSHDLLTAAALANGPAAPLGEKVLAKAADGSAAPPAIWTGLGADEDVEQRREERRKRRVTLMVEQDEADKKRMMADACKGRAAPPIAHIMRTPSLLLEAVENDRGSDTDMYAPLRRTIVKKAQRGELGEGVDAEELLRRMQTRRAIRPPLIALEYLAFGIVTAMPILFMYLSYYALNDYAAGVHRTMTAERYFLGTLIALVLAVVWRRTPNYNKTMDCIRTYVIFSFPALTVGTAALTPLIYPSFGTIMMATTIVILTFVPGRWRLFVGNFHMLLLAFVLYVFGRSFLSHITNRFSFIQGTSALAAYSALSFATPTASAAGPSSSAAAASTSFSINATASAMPDQLLFAYLSSQNHQHDLFLMDLVDCLVSLASLLIDALPLYASVWYARLLKGEPETYGTHFRPAGLRFFYSELFSSAERFFDVRVLADDLQMTRDAQKVRFHYHHHHHRNAATKETATTTTTTTSGGAVIGFHPHGVFPITLLWVHFTRRWERMFAGCPRIVSHGASIIFQTPLLRDMAMTVGARCVTRQAIEHVISEGLTPLIVPGGQAEMLHMRISSTELHIVTYHTGFIRLAMQHKRAVLPLLSFGEQDLMGNIYAPKMQMFFLKRVGFGFPVLPMGQWNLPIPTKARLRIVLGKPVYPDEGFDDYSNPDHVARVAEKYFEELREIFYRYRDDAGYPNMVLYYHSDKRNLMSARAMTATEPYKNLVPVGGSGGSAGAAAAGGRAAGDTTAAAGVLPAPSVDAAPAPAAAEGTAAEKSEEGSAPAEKPAAADPKSKKKAETKGEEKPKAPTPTKGAKGKKGAAAAAAPAPAPKASTPSKKKKGANNNDNDDAAEEETKGGASLGIGADVNAAPAGPAEEEGAVTGASITSKQSEVEAAVQHLGAGASAEGTPTEDGGIRSPGRSDSDSGSGNAEEGNGTKPSAPATFAAAVAGVSLSSPPMPELAGSGADHPSA